MPDVVDAQTRSRMMAGIRARDTKPELQIRRLLHREGFRYRLHVRTLPGHPDLVLPKYNAVVFVNGCFWHGHDCHLFKWPKSRADWWRSKIERNRANDQRCLDALVTKDWRVATVWECSLKGRQKLAIDDVVGMLIEWLVNSADQTLEVKGKANE
ncbi:MAG: DNA mismatch endonuclease Vsr [Thermomicrobiales bacterium]|nr:DNA mismatch endonuclease Vsr [Thermomicrobiales bacterium]